MKIQDILFIGVLGYLLFKRSPRLVAGFGMGLLLLSIPLFAKWVFFTAERMVWYGVVFLLLSIVLHILQLKKTKTS
jgi:hypothetical protein